MSDAFELEICQGKYRYRYEAGKQEVWRNGEPWEVMNGRLIGDKFVFSLAIELDEAIKERDALRSELSKQQALTDAAQHIAEVAQSRANQLQAKVSEMEQQEPVGKFIQHPSHGMWEQDGYGDNPDAKPLYALPGAQNVPKAVAYLDIGAGGYMDIGTDLTDEELDAIPKGRHMLGIVGTYGVDGYLPAHPAPSVPDGWKEAAIAWEVCASIHREYGKGKDPFFNTRQGDFVKHANNARAMLAKAPETKP